MARLSYFHHQKQSKLLIVIPLICSLGLQFSPFFLDPALLYILLESTTQLETDNTSAGLLIINTHALAAMFHRGTPVYV